MPVADPVAIERAKTEKKLRAEMQRLGVGVVRARFIARQPVTDAMPYPDAIYARQWLADEERKARRRERFLTAVAVVAAIAACIAAWPIVRGWFGSP
jgi:hypothetical protein